MTARVLLRDGSKISEQMLQRLIAIDSYAIVLASGLGTGYSGGVVGRLPSAAGADPNHFAVIADGATMVLTCRAGWALIQKDGGGVTMDPKGFYVNSDAPLSVTVPANATGGVRNDTICLRVDLTTAPAADGSNLLSLYCVPGASGGGLSNAPADASTGAVYHPLAVVATPNAATLLTQGIVTDKRVGSKVNVTVPYAGAPTGSLVTWCPGDQATDSNGILWTCTVAGAPGTWVDSKAVLSAKVYGNASAIDSAMASTTPALTNGAHQITIVVPPSGKVRVDAAVIWDCTAAADINLHIKPGSGAVVALTSWGQVTVGLKSMSFGSTDITGLTPGSMTFGLYFSTSSGTLTIRNGQTRGADGIGTWFKVTTMP